MLYLKKIGLDDKEIVLDSIKELVMNGSNRDGLWYEDCESYEIMLQNLKRHESTKFTDFNQDINPCIQYLLIRKEDNKMVGAVSVRPYLTKKLDESYGGNIGYSIRPSERQKGYATKGLKLAIEKCKEINPNGKIIVCCFKDNVGSRKTILKNGGMLIEEKIGIITHQKYEIK
ncbi:MAG: GNAT family N-acetyltransferase [Clostridia bacterium]|nr:GNAT family N-acetyltransferase [Clostridia bacterium]